MKKLPERLLQSLEGLEGFHKEAFVKVHESGEQVTSIRFNPNKIKTPSDERAKFIDADVFSSANENGLLKKTSIARTQLPIAEPVPWSEYGFYLRERPSFTFDPLFHAGCYYVQEASSMFLEQAFHQLLDLSTPLRVLDLCAAPGGKSTHIQSLISPDSLLVSNEIIRSRNNILVDNIVKWGCGNVFVSNNDPSAFQRLKGYFDVMLIDAPCSGSGLFRKDADAIDEWSLNNVQLCCQRQKRILADALPALKQNGILIYSTCSYSKEEDEDIGNWLVEKFNMEPLELKTEESWNIVETCSPEANTNGYRFYPDRSKGEGLFLACFRNTSGSGESKLRPQKTEKASRKEQAIIQPYIKDGALELIRNKDSFIALPIAVVHEYSVLKPALNLSYAGVGIGQIMKDRLVPGHSLAMSTIISDRVPANELSYEQAIKYLQRQDVNLSTTDAGWQLAGYKGYNLGWINVLANRINNYYPRELRILKQQNDSAFEK